MYTVYPYDIRFVNQSEYEKIYIHNNVKRLTMYYNKLCSLNIFHIDIDHRIINIIIIFRCMYVKRKRVNYIIIKRSSDVPKVTNNTAKKLSLKK